MQRRFFVMKLIQHFGSVFLGENDERPLLFGGLWWQPSFDSLSRSTTSSKFWFEVDVNNDGDVDVNVDDEVVVDSDAFPD